MPFSISWACSPPLKSYSGRMSSGGLALAFRFILPSFVPCRASSTDDPNDAFLLSMSDNEEPPALRHSFRQQTILIGGAIWIIDCHSQRITENCARLVE